VLWTIDLKKSGTVYKGKAQPKADVTIILSDSTLVDLADGKVTRPPSYLSVNANSRAQTTGQKAFMTGKLKTKGNMMLATKLDTVLKVCLACHLCCILFMLLVIRVPKRNCRIVCTNFAIIHYAGPVSLSVEVTTL